MAKATKLTRTVTRTVTEEVSDGVTLKLSDDEARVLAVIIAKIAGDPKASPRRYVDTVGDALHSAGFSGLMQPENRLTGSLFFKDYGN
jgi:hypothetical protein